MFWRLGFWKKDKEAHMTINNDNNREVNNKKNISDNKEMNQPEFKEINSDNAHIVKMYIRQRLRIILQPMRLRVMF